MENLKARVHRLEAIDILVLSTLEGQRMLSR